MTNWDDSAAFRCVIAIAMTLGLLLSPIGVSAFHNSAALAAAEMARHAELAAQTVDQGHVHDDAMENV